MLRLKIRAPLALLALASCGPKKPQSAVRTVTILAINDTYRVEGLVEAGTGGLARLRALREALEADRGELLLLHAGDMLNPSFMSRAYLGDQMIEGLNLLDGDASSFDNRMFVIFGNHEFDRGKLTDAPKLDSQIEAAGFRWVNSNVVFKQGEDEAPLVAAPNLVADAITEVNGVKVGLMGVTIDSSFPAYVDHFEDPIETARAKTAALRAAGAELVVAVTHLAMAQDEALLAALGADGPDLIVGGHDHTRQCAVVEGHGVYKADADASTASVFTISVEPGKAPAVDHRYAFLGGTPATSPSCPSAPLNLAVAPDPDLQAWTDALVTRFDAEWCQERLSLPPGCLSEALGRTNTDFVAEEDRIRRFETSAGDWVADTMRGAMADRGATIAFVNAGSLRLNQDIPGGSLLTRRHAEELLGFPANLRLIELDGATLQQVVDHAISDWTGSGHWLQVSGFAYRHDPQAGTATGLTLLEQGGARPIRPDEKLLAVTNDFLLDPAKGQDGYTMLRPDMVRAEGPELKALLQSTLQAAGEAGISPKAEGRICNTVEGGPCLAISP